MGGLSIGRSALCRGCGTSRLLVLRGPELVGCLGARLIRLPLDLVNLVLTFHLRERKGRIISYDSFSDLSPAFIFWVIFVKM